MEWWQLVFALILIAAYVIKHIVAVQQETQQTRPPAPSAPKSVVMTSSDEDVARERTELDRRLEEAIERRRDMEESPISSRLPQRSIPMPAPPVVRPVPRYQPPVAVPRPAPVKPTIPVVVAAPPVPGPKQMPPIALGVAATVTARPVSPAVRQVLDLLKSGQSLAAAVVLREILDRPVSQRRRRT